jgi:hydrogenase maturation protease
LSGVEVNPGRPEIGPYTVLFGIGNCGRSDDGLGWAFLDAIQKMPGFCGRAEYRYQLQVEDALLASRAKNVVFIDSSRSPLSTGFEIRACLPAKDFEFTTHVLPPRAVLHYCQDLYAKTPPATIVGIQGYSWELQTGLSDQAAINLARALAFFADPKAWVSI